MVRTIQESIAAASKDTDELMKKKQGELIVYEKEYDEIKDKMEQIVLDGYDRVKKQIKDYETLSIEFDQKIKNSKRNAAFFENNNVCPTCNQEI